MQQKIQNELLDYSIILDSKPVSGFMPNEVRTIKILIYSQSSPIGYSPPMHHLGLKKRLFLRHFPTLLTRIFGYGIIFSRRINDVREWGIDEK